MTLFDPKEPVDGGGLPLAEHVAHLAELLNLNEKQKSLLLAEIRNALVPVHFHQPTRGSERVLALMDAIAKQKVAGPTKTFPQGKIHPADEGELQIRLGTSPDGSKIVLEFGKQITWIGFDHESAKEFAYTLLAHVAKVTA